MAEELFYLYYKMALILLVHTCNHSHV